MKNQSEASEFYIPTLGLSVEPYLSAENKQGIHHVGRYQWACSVLQNRRPGRILDIACGAGYGSFMLASAIPKAEVIGADYDERAIEYAKAHYARDNLQFSSGDMAQWSDGTSSLGEFDAIVSFETIEHVLHREIAFMRICENLSDAGALLLSTPCGRRTYNNLLPGWEHHKIEYGYPDLYRLLARFFRTILAPRHPNYPAPEIWEQINHGRSRYYNRMNPLVCEGPIRVSIPDYATMWEEPSDGIKPR